MCFGLDSSSLGLIGLGSQSGGSITTSKQCLKRDPNCNLWRCMTWCFFPARISTSPVPRTLQRSTSGWNLSAFSSLLLTPPFKAIWICDIWKLSFSGIMAYQGFTGDYKLLTIITLLLVLLSNDFNWIIACSLPGSHGHWRCIFTTFVGLQSSILRWLRRST